MRSPIVREVLHRLRNPHNVPEKSLIETRRMARTVIEDLSAPVITFVMVEDMAKAHERGRLRAQGFILNDEAFEAHWEKETPAQKQALFEDMATLLRAAFPDASIGSWAVRPSP